MINLESNINRMAVYAADRLSADMQGLIFRAQRDGGTGLNAHLEIINQENNNNAGRVVGLHICGTESVGKTSRGYICSGETVTAAYWLQHSLPVIVMVYEHERDRILWENITPDNLEVTGSKWEITIPYDQVYDFNAAKIISNLTCTSPYLAHLALDRPWIELIAGGREIFLEMDEWINQPSSRGNLRLCVSGDDGGIYQWPFQTTPDMPHVFRIPSLFPWAELSVDKDFYYERNQKEPETGKLLPYSVEAGEIARFRFTLSLNNLGRAFLAAEPYICRGIFPDPKQPFKFGDDYEAGLKFMLYKRV